MEHHLLGVPIVTNLYRGAIVQHKAHFDIICRTHLLLTQERLQKILTISPQTIFKFNYSFFLLARFVFVNYTSSLL
jgi:hypothetical protein